MSGFWQRLRDAITGRRTVCSSGWVMNGPHCCDEGWVSDGREHDPETCLPGAPAGETREQRLARLNAESRARAMRRP